MEYRFSTPIKNIWSYSNAEIAVIIICPSCCRIYDSRDAGQCECGNFKWSAYQFYYCKCGNIYKQSQKFCIHLRETITIPDSHPRPFFHRISDTSDIPDSQIIHQVQVVIGQITIPSIDKIYFIIVYIYNNFVFIVDESIQVFLIDIIATNQVLVGVAGFRLFIFQSFVKNSSKNKIILCVTKNFFLTYYYSYIQR